MQKKTFFLQNVYRVTCYMQDTADIEFDERNPAGSFEQMLSFIFEKNHIFRFFGNFCLSAFQCKQPNSDYFCHEILKVQNCRLRF